MLLLKPTLQHIVICSEHLYTFQHSIIISEDSNYSEHSNIHYLHYLQWTSSRLISMTIYFLSVALGINCFSGIIICSAGGNCRRPLISRKVEGQPPNSISLQMTPSSEENCWGSSDDEAETHPRGLGLEKVAPARECLALACNLVNTGINETFN